MRSLALAATLAAALLAGGPAGPAGAQTPEPTARLRAVLPADVAERVLARISAARARQLPTAALENRALKFAAKGVAPADIERAVAEQAERMVQAREAIARGRGRAEGAEIEAGAEAMRLGLRDAQVSALAREAPSGRSLAVPLYVVGSLIDRGLTAESALERVQQRLLSRASDVELERLPAEMPPQADAPGQARRAEAGQAGADAARPEAAGQGAARGGGRGAAPGGGRGTAGPPGQSGGGPPGRGVGQGGPQGGGKPTTGKPAGTPGGGRPPGAGGKPAGTPAGPPASVPSAGAGKEKGKKPPKPDKP
jgi:translation initiation factor IF-2